MSDYRAATKVHIGHLFDSQHARQSLLTNLACLKGERIRDECIAQYAPTHVPANPDLSRSPLYETKNNYSLTGVPNAQTGASGYTSRSITQPFINRGMQHFKQDSQSDRALSLKQCMELLERTLEGDDKLGKQAQHAAGQAILNFRQVYAADEHWGHPEKVIMKTLIANGLLSQEQTDRIDATLMFEDPSISVLKKTPVSPGRYCNIWKRSSSPGACRIDPKLLQTSWRWRNRRIWKACRSCTSSSTRKAMASKTVPG